MALQHRHVLNKSLLILFMGLTGCSDPAETFDETIDRRSASPVRNIANALTEQAVFQIDGKKVGSPGSTLAHPTATVKVDISVPKLNVPLEGPYRIGFCNFTKKGTPYFNNTVTMLGESATVKDGSIDFNTEIIAPPRAGKWRLGIFLKSGQPLAVSDEFAIE